MVISLWLVALVAAACDDPTGERFLSPLPAGIDSRLVTNAWEIVEVVQQGKLVPLDSVPSFIVGFQWRGRLDYASGCLVGSFRVDFETQQRYRLRPVVTVGTTCESPRGVAEQQTALVRALEATSEYNFHEGRLWLTGTETRFVLEVLEAYPTFPAADSSLILNRWRWVEVRDQEGIVTLDALLPINMAFTQYGILSVEFPRRLNSYYRSAMSESGGYVLTQVELAEYAEGTAAQAQRALDALLATTEYELHDDRLILRGANVEIVMEIERPVN